MKINFGSGPDKREGYINVDRKEWMEPDVLHDLNKRPFPFEDNSADKILALDLLEHLIEPEKAIEEFYRILKNGGILIVRFPYYKSSCAHHSLEHKRAGFSDKTFDEYDPSTKWGKIYKNWHGRMKFKIIKKEWITGRWIFWDKRGITITLQAIKKKEGQL